MAHQKTVRLNTRLIRAGSRAWSFFRSKQFYRQFSMLKTPCRWAIWSGRESSFSRKTLRPMPQANTRPPPTARYTPVATLRPPPQRSHNQDQVEHQAKAAEEGGRLDVPTVTGQEHEKRGGTSISSSNPEISWPGARYKSG